VRAPENTEKMCLSSHNDRELFSFGLLCSVSVISSVEVCTISLASISGALSEDAFKFKLGTI